MKYFSGKKTCSEGHANASRRFRSDKKHSELRYLQFHIHCLTAHLWDIVCVSCKHFVRALPIAIHAINFDFKVREFETAKESGRVTELYHAC
jgi:hypothetical protein